MPASAASASPVRAGIARTRGASSSASSVPSGSCSARETRHNVSIDGFPAPDSIRARIVLLSPDARARSPSDIPWASAVRPDDAPDAVGEDVELHG